MGLNNARENRFSVYTAGSMLIVNAESNRDIAVLVHDMIGHLVISQKYNQSYNQIPVSVDPGIYLVTVIGENRTEIHKVYIK